MKSSSITSININNIVIEVVVRKYKSSKSIKLFFRANILYVSVPYNLSDIKIKQILEENKDIIYNKYVKIASDKNMVKTWKTGEGISYLGEEFEIIRYNTSKKRINIVIDENKKTFNIYVPNDLQEQDIKIKVDKAVKNIFKENTYEIIKKRLDYFEEVTNIKYNSFKITDSISKYGSCRINDKKLFFSLRLIMLNSELIDAVIVHELCHIVYPNHSSNFYNLAQKYIPDYLDKDKLLKSASNSLII